MISGYKWLKKENPKINWRKAEVDVKTISTQPSVLMMRTVQIDQVKMVIGMRGRLPSRGTE